MEDEGLNQEFKEKVDDFRAISKTACAFANAFGGRILIGVKDNGGVVGVRENELDTLQQRLEGAIQVISPTPFHKITIEEKEGKKTISVEVYQLGQGAFCTLGGIVYYRASNVNSRLEGRTLQDYMVNRHIKSFDESPSPAKIGDIEPNKVAEFLKKRSPELVFDEKKIPEYLVNLGLARKNGALSITNVAILFFGREQQMLLPQNEVKLVRFAGTTPIDVIDSKYVNSDILSNLKVAQEFISKNTRTAMKIEKLEREEVPDYPPRAIREALVNAITHRDYFSKDTVQVNIFEDRIEIINPGTLPDGLSLQLLGTISIQRNPITYRLMRDLKFVEGLATGIPRMRESMKEAGLPEPVFEELGSFFRVTIHNRQTTEKSELNKRQKRALNYLEKSSSLTSKTYRKINGISNPIAVADLNNLISRGILKKVGKTRGAYYIKTG